MKESPLLCGGKFELLTMYPKIVLSESVKSNPLATLSEIGITKDTAMIIQLL